MVENTNLITQTTRQAPYIEESSRRLIDSVGGTQDILDTSGNVITPGVQGLIDQP